MRPIFLAVFILGLSILASGASFAQSTVSLTAFSDTNNAPSGVGDVTVSFTTNDSTFGGAQNGGWYVTIQLPAGFTTGTTYSTAATCSSNTVNFTSTSSTATTALGGSPPLCAVTTGGFVIISNPTGAGVLLANGSNTEPYTVTIKNVTNPSSTGTYDLQSLSVYNHTTGSLDLASSNLSDFGDTIAPPVPLSDWSMLLLAAVLAGTGYQVTRRNGFGSGQSRIPS